MARLYHAGCEVSEGQAIDGVGTGIVTARSRDTTTFRSGLASWKFDSGASNVAGGANRPTTFVDGVTYYVRGYFNAAAAPSAAAVILFVAGATTGMAVRLRTDGGVELVVNAVAQGSPSASITDGTWHRVELKVVAAATGNWSDAEVRLDGVSVATWTGTQTRSGGTFLNWGWCQAPGANKVINVDDVAVNDSTGATNNSWPGDGKVVLLVPTSDSAVGAGWTNDNAATSSLFNSVKNTPPTGIADTTTGGGGHQIRNATSNANANYDANMTTYSAAGVGASDTVNAVIPWTVTGAPVGTSAKQGTVGVASNPTIANVALGGTVTPGAFWESAAVGTYPTSWKWSIGAVANAPSVTLGTAPVMRVTQVTASTRIAMACFMGVYVDYTPASGTAWTQPVNDTLSLADSVATAAGKAATIPDTLAVADATALARTIAQTVADTLSIADATALARDIAQAIIDTAALADLASTAAGKGATVNDTLALTDAVRFDQTLTLADTVALTDVVAQAEEIHIADTLSIGDLCDPVKTTGSVAYTQPVTDTVSVADALLFDRAQAVADTVAVADQLASQAALARTLADTVSMADTLAYQAALLRTIADTVGVADVAAPVKSTGAVDWAQPVADTVTVADQIAVQAALARTIADTVAVTDATVAERGLTRALADTLQLADQLASLTERNLQVADTISLADLVASQAHLQRLLGDTVAITDELFNDLVVPTPLPAGWITFATGDRIGVLYPGRLDTAAQALGGISVPGQGEGELALTGVGGIATTGG